MTTPLRIGPGGPFLAPPLAAPQSAIFGDEESDGWWAGVNLCGVSAPRASAAAALGLSVAIAGGFVQQDEVAPWLASEASSTSVPTQRARVAPTFVRWYAPDELPTVVAAFVPEEEYPSAPLNTSDSVAGVLWAIDEEVIPAVPSLEEETTWVASAVIDKRVWGPLLTADELIQVSAAAALEESEWSLPMPLASRAAAQPLGVDDELSRGPVIEEGEYALDLRAATAKIAAQPLAADEEIVVTVAAALDEAEWLRYAVLSPAAQPLYLPDPDEAPAGTLRGTAEEDYWQPLAPLTVRSWAPVGVADEEIVSQPTATLDETYELRVERASAAPATTLPAWQADELPPASAGFLEETDWPVPQPVLARPLSSTWVDEERVPPPTLGIEDEYHWVAGPYSARVALGYVTVDEERVPPPAPLGVEESYHWTAGAYGARTALSYDLTGVDADLPTSAAVIASLARTYVVPVQTRLRVIALQARTRVIALQDRIRIILAQYRSK